MARRADDGCGRRPPSGRTLPCRVASRCGQAVVARTTMPAAGSVSCVTREFFQGGRHSSESPDDIIGIRITRHRARRGAQRFTTGVSSSAFSRGGEIGSRHVSVRVDGAEAGTCVQLTHTPEGRGASCFASTDETGKRAGCLPRTTSAGRTKLESVEGPHPDSQSDGQ